MLNVLFRQSDVEDPYALYAGMMREQPVYFDAVNNIWAVYPYATCYQLLTAASACIPDPNHSLISPLSDSARRIANHLVRLQNPPRHEAIRPVVVRLFEQVRPVQTHTLLDGIFAHHGRSFDWVAVVARRLPAQALLAGFGFTPDAAERLLELLDGLVKIMLPGKSAQTIEVVNTAADEAYPLVEQHITGTAHLHTLLDSASDHDDILQLVTANLIGLLIQSYDAGRGLLSNMLLPYIQRAAEAGADYRALVVETLRYDPPVHSTRRILAQNMVVEGVAIQAGAQVLVVLAAANRDPQRFSNPEQFDPLRPNNEEHLTFGVGAHSCLARHYIVDLAAETLRYLATRCPGLRILTDQVEYEPLIHARLPRTLQIAF